MPPTNDRNQLCDLIDQPETSDDVAPGAPPRAVRRCVVAASIVFLLLVVLSACSSGAAGGDDGLVIAGDSSDGSSSESSGSDGNSGAADARSDRGSSSSGQSEPSDQSQDDTNTGTDGGNGNTEPPALPRQEISFNIDGKKTTDRNTSVTTKTRLYTETVEARSPTGAGVSVSAGPDTACSYTPGSDQLFLQGNVGDVCVVTLIAEGTDRFAETKVVVSVRFEAAFHVGWTSTSKPTGGTVKRGENIEVTVDASAATEDLSGVTINQDFPCDGSCTGVASSNGKRLTFKGAVGPSASCGKIGVLVAYGEEGQSVYSYDGPETIAWTVIGCDGPDDGGSDEQAGSTPTTEGENADQLTDATSTTVNSGADVGSTATTSNGQGQGT